MITFNKIRIFIHENCGHFGMAKTFDRVRERFHGPKMRTDVQELVRACEICRQIRSPQQTHTQPDNLETISPLFGKLPRT